MYITIYYAHWKFWGQFLRLVHLGLEFRSDNYLRNILKDIMCASPYWGQWFAVLKY